MTDDKVEVIRRYAQGVEKPDYYKLLSDATLMAIEAQAAQALADTLAAAVLHYKHWFGDSCSCDDDPCPLYEAIEAARHQNARQL